jgi:hypothetical protein
MGDRPEADAGDQPVPAGLADPTPAAYPGWLDQRLLTPSAPLAPGADMRVLPAPIFVPRSSPDPTWAPDPTGRHQWRWWGGVAWTDHVADDGVATEDPLEPD